ncbi:MAG: cob(I)yrinic acid a,c-diamide adenosyltransferase [Victivallaceae bacterium]|nr:cob(I)yrinic acid a,c-diamide adenosyltransferase [Victivallaceae bacterium]
MDGTFVSTVYYLHCQNSRRSKRKNKRVKPSRSSILLNYTGNGKGKTSAAFGLALRALGRGWPIAVIQFCKTDMETGEFRFFHSHFPEIEFLHAGCGFTWDSNFTLEDHRRAAQAGWRRAEALLQDPHLRLLVLDELNMALAFGHLELVPVLHALKTRAPQLNVVATGRDAPAELLEISDLVSNIEEVKHPFQKGVAAMEGIDF